jgi:hypothetical protein
MGIHLVNAIRKWQRSSLTPNRWPLLQGQLDGTQIRRPGILERGRHCAVDSIQHLPRRTVALDATNF